MNVATTSITLPLTPNAQPELLKLQSEINKLRTEVQKWRILAQRDSLTGCLRRDAFMQLIAERIQTGWMPQQVSLVVIDIDHFKKINDSFGHHMGDEVLASLGKVLEQNLPQGSLACRMGGEEFVLLIPHAIQSVSTALESLKNAINTTEVFSLTQNVSLKFTASMGAVGWDTRNSMSLATVQADLAMYEAKKGGRNRIVIK